MIRDTSATDRPIERTGIARRAWILAGLGVVVLAGGAVLYPSASRWAQADRSVERSRIRTGQVARGDLERDLAVQGQIVAAFHPTLYSPEQGLVRILVQAGEPIRRGQELAVVDSPELMSLLDQERSNLAATQAGLERSRIEARQENLENRQAIDLLAVEVEAAERARRRAEDSRAAGIVNMVEYETAQDNYKVKQLELAHARQTADLTAENLEFEIRDQEMRVESQRLLVENIKRQASELTVRSPVDGLVSRLDVKEQDAVVKGQPILAVVDLSAYEVEVMVPETYADEIVPGTASVISYNGVEYPGKVTRMSPEVEGSQVRGVVAFAGGMPADLKQNQRVSVRLIMESRPDVLKVARGPFLEDGGGRRAYVLEGSLAVLRPIAIGAVSVDEVEITEGLEAGETIIISDMTRFEGVEKVLIRN